MHKRIRLFILGIKWPPETFIQRKLRSLAENKNFEVIAGISIPKSRIDKTFNIENVKTVKMPHTDDPITYRFFSLIKHLLINLFRPNNIYVSIKTALEQSKNIKEFFNNLLAFLIVSHIKADIVHFEWASYGINYQRFLGVLNIPFLLSARGSIFSVKASTNNTLKNKLKPVVENAVKIICVSRQMQDVVHKLYPQSKDKTTVIYNGIDLDIFKCNQNRKLEKALNIAIIGNFVWIKGIEHGIFVFKKFLEKKGDGILTIIGDGKEKERLLFTVKDLGLESKVRFTGKLKEQDVAKVLRDQDVLLHTAYAFGIPNVVYEAMATCTVPVVTLTFREDIKSLELSSLFTFPLLDTEKAVSILIDLYNRREELKILKYRCRKTAERHFSFVDMKTKYTELYKEFST